MLDDQGDPPRLLKMLFEPALQDLQAKHPDLEQILQTILRIGKELQTGTKQIGMGVPTTIKYMEYGLLLTPEGYGIGRISCRKQE